MVRFRIRWPYVALRVVKAPASLLVVVPRAAPAMSAADAVYLPHRRDNPTTTHRDLKPAAVYYKPGRFFTFCGPLVSKRENLYTAP